MVRRLFPHILCRHLGRNLPFLRLIWLGLVRGVDMPYYSGLLHNVGVQG